MNKFQGYIKSIESRGSLSKVRVNINSGISLNVLVIDTPETAPYLTPEHQVTLLFKETGVILSCDTEPGISIENRVPCTVDHVEKGQLLTAITLKSDAGNIEAVIPTSMSEQLELLPGKAVIAMVKLNDIMLSSL
ncbi:tobe domain protein [Robertkochia marina]|uniref:Tobe domain protein n=1 Tax=Robertkochia marina TaxID=1227945 RepID=A0A4S3M266_9FLAO|nr:TOBE domain-containing protein [Robertkochia marina]THD67565.1 tobe domain protein [Robertkochia marina]TRZ44567.1 tobe domain protein [Robertkochia marina]